MANEDRPLAPVLELSALRPRSNAEVQAEAEAIVAVLNAGIPGPADRLHTIQRLQAIWPMLPEPHRDYLRAATSQALQIAPARFDFLITCDSLSSVKAGLAYVESPPPALQPDETHWLSLPPSFITRFIRWSYRSRAHIAYLAWSALWLLGAAARRNYYMPAGIDSFIYPNLYLLIEGDSGSGKSYAIDLARSLLGQMNTKLEAIPQFHGMPTIGRTVHIIEDSTTKAKLETVLQTQTRQRCAPIAIADQPSHWESCAAVIADEAVTLLGRDMFSVEELIVAFTRMFDGHYAGDTVSRGQILIPNLALSLLLGSAMSWLQKTMTDTVFQGGFMGARCLCISREPTKRQKSYPWVPVLDPMEADHLSTYLTRLATARPRAIHFTDDARTLYEDWYRQEDPANPDERIRGYYARRFLHVQKVSMLLALARDPEADVEATDVGVAVDIFEREESYMLPAFLNMVHSTDVGRDADWIRNYLVKMGGHVQQNEMTRAGSRRMRGHQLRELLETMIASGEVATRKGPAPLGGGQRATIIYLTEYEDSQGNEIKRVPRLGRKRTT